MAFHFYSRKNRAKCILFLYVSVLLNVCYCFFFGNVIVPLCCLFYHIGVYTLLCVHRVLICQHWNLFSLHHFKYPLCLAYINITTAFIFRCLNPFSYYAALTCIFLIILNVFCIVFPIPWAIFVSRLKCFCFQFGFLYRRM